MRKSTSAGRDFLTLLMAPPLAAAGRRAPLGLDASVRYVHRTAQLAGQRADRERIVGRGARVDQATIWWGVEDGA